MRFLLFFLVVICWQGRAAAQTVEGVVKDYDTHSPISGATILNTHSGIVNASDGNGYFTLPAEAGDSIIVRHTSYQVFSFQVPFTVSNYYKLVYLNSLNFRLKEATIVGKTKYQQDSEELHQMYGHELNKTLVPAPKFQGLGVSGVFGWLADKITGNSKKDKRFRQQFVADDQAKFIDSRYTPKLVASMTHIHNTDSIAVFINNYPMEYQFARTATDLELKAWIRDNYKDFTRKKK